MFSKNISVVVVVLFLLFFSLSCGNAMENNLDNVTINDEIVIGSSPASHDFLNDKFGDETDMVLITENKVVKDSIKPAPIISIDKYNVKTIDSINISLKDNKDMPIVGANLDVSMGNINENIITNDKGIATLNFKLPKDNYALLVKFNGNNIYSPITRIFDIDVSLLKSHIEIDNNIVVNGNYVSIYLKDEYNNPISDVKLSVSLDNKISKNTDEKGKAKFKINSNLFGNRSLTVNFKGNNYYESLFNEILLFVQHSTSIKIGNTILLTKGYLRIYFKMSSNYPMSNCKLLIKIGDKTFKKTTNKEGVIIFNPHLNKGKYKITVKFEGNKHYSASNTSKKVKVIKGKVKNPLKKKIKTNHGIPNIDYMPKNYVMADNKLSYTITKSQYNKMLKRDSYCLYLKNNVPKYTFFKSKAEPKLNHIIKREKANLFEYSYYFEMLFHGVKKQKTITAHLSGRSCTYGEFLDIQNTKHSGGPASASMCSQVLKKYVSEEKLIKQSKTDYYGTTPKNLKKALEKNHFKCSLYSKSSFNKALKQLKKGGSAVIFHANNHYVAILDISKNAKKVLVANPGEYYSKYSKGLKTKWLTVKHMKHKFSSHDSTGLIVKLIYNLKKSTKKKLNKYYLNMGGKSIRKNTHESIW